MEVRLISIEQENLVINNQKLVYHFVQKLNIPYDDYEDIISIGNIGLIKAAATFNKSANTKFSTYALHCIQNEILMHFRKEKSRKNYISLSSTIINDSGDDEVELIELIEDPDGDFVEKITHNEVFEKVICIILIFLTPKERFIILHELSGTHKCNIALSLNVTASYISQLVRKIKQKIKLCFESNEQFIENFQMKIINNSYQISFSYQSIAQFDSFLLSLSQNAKLSKENPDVKIRYNKKEILIRAPAHPESFSFIAEILQQIEEWNSTFMSDENT